MNYIFCQSKYSKGETGSSPPFPFLPFPFLPISSLCLLPSPSLEVGPLNPARWSGERCKLASGVWGGAPAEIEFGEF